MRQGEFLTERKNGIHDFEHSGTYKCTRKNIRFKMYSNKFQFKILRSGQSLSFIFLTKMKNQYIDSFAILTSIYSIIQNQNPFFSFIFNYNEHKNLSIIYPYMFGMTFVIFIIEDVM